MAEAVTRAALEAAGGQVPVAVTAVAVGCTYRQRGRHHLTPITTVLGSQLHNHALVMWNQQPSLQGPMGPVEARGSSLPGRW